MDAKQNDIFQQAIVLVIACCISQVLTIYRQKKGENNRDNLFGAGIH